MFSRAAFYLVTFSKMNAKHKSTMSCSSIMYTKCESYIVVVLWIDRNLYNMCLIYVLWIFQEKVSGTTGRRVKRKRGLGDSD